MRIMKRYITVLFIWVMLPVICIGQIDTVYYDYSGQRTTDKKEAIDYCIYQPQTDNTFIGKKYSVKDKQLESIGNYSSIDPIVLDGHVEGYENGYIAADGTYDHNKKTGTWTYYREGTKTIWYTETYVSNDKIKLKSYYPNGRLKRKEKHNDTYTIASGKCFNEKGKKMSFTSFYTAPKALYRVDEYVAQNIKYPDSARNRSIEGNVIVRFAVNGDGDVTDVKVIKGIAGGCNEESVRVISAMPKWSGGIKDDKKVSVYFYQSITFRPE